MLGGSLIPQGHTTGYPTYRLEWQGLGSLARRLRGCMTGVRAQPFAAWSDEMTALEVYLASRAMGMPFEGPAVRP
jgi:L-cysteine S-thiosulfotransferase